MSSCFLRGELEIHALDILPVCESGLARGATHPTLEQLSRTESPRTIFRSLIQTNS